MSNRICGVAGFRVIGYRYFINLGNYFLRKLHHNISVYKDLAVYWHEIPPDIRSAMPGQIPEKAGLSGRTSGAFLLDYTERKKSLPKNESFPAFFVSGKVAYDVLYLASFMSKLPFF